MKLRQILIYTIATAGIFVTAGFLFMPQQKIVYVNIKEVFDQFDYTKKLKKEFELVSNARKNTLDSINFELRVMAQKLEATKNRDLAAVFEVKRRDLLYEQEVFSRENEALSAKYDDQIHTQISAYLKDFGKEMGYDLILSAENLDNVLYSKEKYNVTEAAVKFLNARYAGKKLK